MQAAQQQSVAATRIEIKSTELAPTWHKNIYRVHFDIHNPEHCSSLIQSAEVKHSNGVAVHFGIKHCTSEAPRGSIGLYIYKVCLSNKCIIIMLIRQMYYYYAHQINILFLPSQPTNRRNRPGISSGASNFPEQSSHRSPRPNTSTARKDGGQTRCSTPPIW